MSPRTARFLGSMVASVLALGVLSGCTTTPEAAAPEDRPAAEVPEPAEQVDPDEQPSIAQAEAAVLAIAREEYPTMPIESATAYAMGRDAQGTWWVQAWTTASPEFEGEQGEQWFVTWDGESWTLIDYGTGLGTEDFPGVSEWEALQ
ncbi:MAG: hypothetical protein Q7W51_02025 [Coriobacteriia bacterium]|nr:hypothetical protein [Coriobacteriia bacterium]